MDYISACKAEPFIAQTCKTSMYQCLQSLHALHTMWRAGVDEATCGSLPWHLRQKAHIIQHLIEDQLDLFGSPSLSHCYGDEDFCGCIKRVCLRTKHPWTLEKRVTEKCRILAGVDGYDLAHPELQLIPDGL